MEITRVYKGIYHDIKVEITRVYEGIYHDIKVEKLGFIRGYIMI